MLIKQFSHTHTHTRAYIHLAGTLCNRGKWTHDGPVRISTHATNVKSSRSNVRPKKEWERETDRKKYAKSCFGRKKIESQKMWPRQNSWNPPKNISLKMALHLKFSSSSSSFLCPSKFMRKWIFAEPDARLTFDISVLWRELLYGNGCSVSDVCVLYSRTRWFLLFQRNAQIRIVCK